MSDSTTTLQPASEPERSRSAWEADLMGFLDGQDAIRRQREQAAEAVDRAQRREALVYRMTLSRGVLRRRRLV